MQVELSSVEEALIPAHLTLIVLLQELPFLEVGLQIQVFPLENLLIKKKIMKGLPDNMVVASLEAHDKASAQELRSNTTLMVTHPNNPVGH